MARSGKGGHVRGGVHPLPAGLLTLGIYTLVLEVDEPIAVSIGLVNPGNVGGVILYYVSANGAGYTLTREVVSPFGTLAFHQFGVSVAAGTVVRCYVEFRDVRGELLARTFVAQDTQP